MVALAQCNNSVYITHVCVDLVASAWCSSSVYITYCVCACGCACKYSICLSSIRMHLKKHGYEVI